MTTTPAQQVLKAVRARLDASGAFGPTSMQGAMLVAPAKASGEPAFFRVEPEDGGSGRFWVSLVTPSRWLSESIESDLVEHGDDLGELIEDELVELGYEGAGLPPTFQHYRSPDLLYTFRTPIPVGVGTPGGEQGVVEVVVLWVLAYEQAFRRLGDMDGASEA